MMKHNKNLILLICSLIFCTQAYSFQNKIVVQNNCSVQKKIVIHINSTDSIVQIVQPEKKVKIDYNNSTYNTASLFVEGKRYSLLPQKKGTLTIDCSDKTTVTFTDLQNKIYNEAYLKSRAIRREASQYVQQIFSDSTLTDHQKDSLYNKYTLYREKADSVTFNHFLLNAPGFASLYKLSVLVSQKSDKENKHKIQELYRLNKLDKAVAKSKLMKDIERKMAIPTIEIGSTMPNFPASEKRLIPINKGKYLIYYASDACLFCKKEMEYLENLNEHLSDVAIVVLDVSSSTKYKEMCSTNNWTYYTDSNFLEKDITYSLSINAFPTGILIVDQVLEKTDFRIEHDKNLIGL